MDFLDLDGDGQPDSGPTGNENGGRVSYIHYAEPFPTMVDLSHVGYSDEPVHLVTAAVETLSTSVGVGIMYLIDTTEYTMEDGQFKFKPKLIRDWEIPYAEDHCYGADCEAHPNEDEWLLFSPHNLDSTYFETDESTDQSHGGGWDGRLYISHYHAGACGSLTSRRWLTPPTRTTASPFTKKRPWPTTFRTVRTVRRWTQASTTLDGYRSSGRLNITTASRMPPVYRPASTSFNLTLTSRTEFDVIPCFAESLPF